MVLAEYLAKSDTFGSADTSGSSSSELDASGSSSRPVDFVDLTNRWSKLINNLALLTQDVESRVTLLEEALKKC